MKILLEVNKKYEKPELHVCCEKPTEEIRSIMDRLEDMFVERVTVYGDQEARTISVSDIVRIYSANKKVYIRTKDATFEVHERLYTLEEKLENNGFVRISNSEIVNTLEIEKLDMGISGTIRMYMKNGDVTYVSRRYVSTIRKKLG